MLHVDFAYPGGNIIVDRIEGDTIYVRPDWSGHLGWWFYFNFRIWNACGRRVTVVFTETKESAPLSVGGACVRFDDGAFAWTSGASDHRSFAIDVPAGVRVVQCATAFPYTAADFVSFATSRPALAVEAIGRSDHGRPVLRGAVGSKHRKHTLILTARSHACESMASFVMEGVVDAWLNGAGSLAETRREKIDLHVVPFIDPDGVEEGLQGKNRSPHDHNRDWLDQPIYTSVRALQTYLRTAIDPQTVLFDLHCPWIRDGRNETLFFCGLHEPMQSELRALQRHLPRDAGNALPFDPADDIAMDTEWLTSTSATIHNWLRDATSVKLATTIEVPYARARDGVVVTPERCRAWGARLADAVAGYFG